jgi:hypothetical protein
MAIHIMVPIILSKYYYKNRVLGIEVINPGPLALNRFMHFELIK